MLNYLKTNYLPIITALVVFFLTSIIYFSPVLEGKVLSQHDIKVWKASSKELRDFNSKNEDNKSCWTNSMFSGMPSYLINNLSEGNKFRSLHRFLIIDGKLKPVHLTFLYFLGFFITLLAFGLNPWLSIVGAFAFGFSSYSIIIIQAGHMSKAMAIGYMGPIVAGVYLAFKKKPLWGAILLALFLSLQIYINHLQITYYTYLIVLIYGVFQIVNTIKTKNYRPFLKSSSYLIVAAALAIGSNYMSLAAVYEYGQESIRGKSELSSNKENRTSGLDRDYATDWSYGIEESFNLLIPNFMGGASTTDLGTKSETYKVLKQMRQPNAKQIVKQMPSYWGSQPFTAGPTYLGAVVLFLFVLALFIVKGELKWWLLVATLLSLFLAWGRNMMWFTDLFFDYMPGYNKFRAVSMTLVIAQFTVPLLAVLGLQKIFFETKDALQLKKPLLYSGGIVAGLLVLLLLFIPSLSSSFSSANDSSMFGQNTSLLEAIKADRLSLFKSDILRSLLFVLLTAGTIWLWISKKLQKKYIFILLALLIISDLWIIDKRYLNSDHFVSSKDVKKEFTASTADLSILEDKSPSYRVLNLSVSTFNDATTSYFHKSIGGYHGAKMRRYQELITHNIHPEMQAFSQALQKQASIQSIDQSLASLNVINMLNTKYIIYSPKAPALLNKSANGNAWFIKELKWVDNADQELAALKTIDCKSQAVADRRFETQKSDFTYDPTASIRLEKYTPNELVYKSKSTSPQVAVFSEIYYNKGWNAYIDGELKPHFRADYVLRALNVPAGEHTIEFKFEPQVVATGSWVGWISSILLLLFILSGFFYDHLQNKKGEQEAA